MKNKKIGIALFAVIAIGGIRGGSVKADYYGDTIRRHEDIATYNGYRAKAEAKMYKQRAKAYQKAQRRFKHYSIAHSEAMSADTALVAVEASMAQKGYKPERSYLSDWASRETAAVITERGGY